MEINRPNDNSDEGIGRIWFVKEALSGNGANWDMAFGHLQDALEVARKDDEVWVAAGEAKGGLSMVGDAFHFYDPDKDPSLDQYWNSIGHIQGTRQYSVIGLFGKLQQGRLRCKCPDTEHIKSPYKSADANL
jgi:hypothetical protein